MDKGSYLDFKKCNLLYFYNVRCEKEYNKPRHLSIGCGKAFETVRWPVIGLPSTDADL